MAAGDFVSFPRNEDGIKITVGPPYGEERAMLYASDKPLPELAFIKSANGMRLLKDDINSVTGIIEKFTTQGQAQLSQASAVIKTVPQ